MLGRIPDSILLAVFAICMGGACHDLSAIPGQGVYVALSGIMSTTCAIFAIDCWFDFPALLRVVGRRA